ncbi:MAG: lysophospholipid acyltransferase family protein [Pirellulales bacterium]
MLSPQGTEILSVALLLCAGGLLILGLLAWLPHPHYSLAQRLCYFYGYVFARIVWRADVPERLPIGDRQGALVICNHISPYDPAFLQIPANRVLHWMVAKEYCEHPALAWFFRIVGSIPVSRGGIDIAATRAAIRYARQGQLVGLFPEGRINMTDQLLLPGRSGAALIALKAQVPVIPCYVSGCPRAATMFGTMFTPARVRLVVGEPIDVSPYAGRDRDKLALEELTRLFLTEIARLAGHEEFQPRLAGRRWKP